MTQESTFLTRAELHDLTGLQRSFAIKRWLAANGIKHLDGADGVPRVLRSVMHSRLGGDKLQPPSNEPRLRLRHA